MNYNWSEDHNDNLQRNMSIEFKRQEESIARHLTGMATQMREELATQMRTLKEEMVTQIKEMTTQILTMQLQMEKKFAEQKRLIQELRSNKDPREKTQNRQIRHLL